MILIGQKLGQTIIALRLFDFKLIICSLIRTYTRRVRILGSWFLLSEKKKYQKATKRTYEPQQELSNNQQRLRPVCAYAQSEQSLCQSFEYTMILRLLTEPHLEFLSLEVGCTGSTESIRVKMPRCWNFMSRLIFHAS